MASNRLRMTSKSVGRQDNGSDVSTNRWANVEFDGDGDGDGDTLVSV